MKLNSLNYKSGSRGHKRKIFGRGFGSGSKRGFKGNKGQGQRSTVNVRIGFEGGQTPLYYRVAKIGFNNHEFKNNYEVISLNQFKFVKGTEVNRKTLQEAKLINKRSKLPIKIIGSNNVTLDKKYNVSVDKVTIGAANKIESSGGKIIYNI